MRTYAVNLMVTTACDRRCPSCNVNIPSTPPVHFSVEELLAVARPLGHVQVLCLTGGEPTVHPDFDRLVPAVADAFDYDQLLLATNGSGLARHLAVLHRFTHIGVTRYSAAFYPGCLDNEDEIEAFRAVCPPGTSLSVYPVVHNPTPKAGRRGRCDKMHATVSCLGGRIYPCCVACGLAGAPSVPVTEAWREEILRVFPPCDLCRSGPD